ncbi:hypothetical protein Sa4125_12090 [Aureimonas sp. SA4125]|uniref:hypothetical protein n=1 Tax=Aureimonas sp. SA4125 TaxID=2826993 RepID=UPI001CC6BA3E|nr:hypothetical protein [Aureimonas sp. SA4125]BDA83667.1 hypothetical protein Sa4125_12090 [Aureimonas sp. SA4125]
MTEAERLEAAMRAAIAAHRIKLRQEIERKTRSFELRFLLARLGLSPPELDIVDGCPSAAALAPDLACRIETRLVAEADRLSRHARAGSARYDINRHVAVRHALAWLRGGPALPDEAGDRRSGRELNARFRRSRDRRPARPPWGAHPGAHPPRPS